MRSAEAPAGPGNDGHAPLESSHQSASPAGANIGKGGAPARSFQVTRTRAPIAHGAPTSVVSSRGPSSRVTTPPTHGPPNPPDTRPPTAAIHHPPPNPPARTPPTPPPPPDRHNPPAHHCAPP